MSLDGYIADPDDGVAEQFGGYSNGPAEWTASVPDLRMSEPE